MIDKSTGKLISSNYVSDAFAFFHTINGYQEDDHIVCDICCYEDGSIVNALFADTLSKISEQSADTKKESVNYYQSLRSQARRYVLPLNVDSKSDKVIRG